MRHVRLGTTAALAALIWATACGEASEVSADGGDVAPPSGDRTDAAIQALDGGSAGSRDAAPVGADDGGGGGDDGSDAGTPGGAALRGEVLFFEGFEDGDLASRGWYDGRTPTSITSAEHVEGSSSSFECRFDVGGRQCAGGKPGRHGFAPQDAVHLSFWMKLSDNWVGSGRAYHPHLLHFLTDIDGDWIGPSETHLTAYVELRDRSPVIALQDALNVDTGCVLRNDDSFVGCDGSFDTYPFTEARSVSACNGIVGDLDGRDCFRMGSGNWYSARKWDSDGPVFVPGRWHFVEAYFRMNSIVDGVGVPDGAIRYWVDGEVAVSSDRILMRTGEHPELAFDQFLIAPYIGDGSPVDQAFWIDDLTVAVGE